jgi:hypothetical protein
MERVRALARGRGIEIAADDYGLTHSREIIAQRTAVWTRTTCRPATNCAPQSEQRSII